MKKQVLIHKHKHDTDYYDASTKAAYEKSIKKIFQANEDMEYYYNLDDAGIKEEEKEFQKEKSKLEDLHAVFVKHNDDYEAKRTQERIKSLEDELKNLKYQKSLFDLAKKGDVKAIDRLLKLRADYEYEGFELGTLG